MEDMEVNYSFWRGRRVFLTGHTGFKGGWLAYWLRKMGAKVTGFALDPEGDDTLFSAASIVDGITDLRGDIREASGIDAAINECRPATVFHLAAQPLVRASYDDPLETFQTNVMGTLNLFEALRRRGKPCQVINVTTDKCYLNREWIWAYRENEPMGGHDPYSASKACVELATDAYRKSFFEGNDCIRLASVRAGNVIGGGDWAKDRILPDLMRGFASGATVLIRQPHAVRPWQHVLDALHGYILLAERIAEPKGQGFAEAWNFGPEASDTADVATIAEIARNAWGTGAIYKANNFTQGPHEANTLKLDSTKARERLDWYPKFNLRQTVQHTVEWYRAYYSGTNVTAIMDDQIGHFGAVT